jgi:hypothetical protein
MRIKVHAVERKELCAIFLSGMIAFGETGSGDE